MQTLHQDWTSTPPPARKRRGAAITELDLLMVEDNRADAILIREMLCEGLPDVQIRITRAVTLARAIEALDSGSFDVILLDLGLPDSFPLQVIDAVNTASGPGTAIVALTGRDDPALTRMLIERNGEDYLVKGSFDADTLGRGVQFAAMRARRRREERERQAHREQARRTASLGWLAEQLTEAMAAPQAASVTAIQDALDGLTSLQAEAPPDLRERLRVVTSDLERALLDAVRAVDGAGEVLSYVVPPEPPGLPCDPVPPVQWALRVARDWVPPHVEYLWRIEPCPRVEAHQQIVAQTTLALVRIVARCFPDPDPEPDTPARLEVCLAPKGTRIALEVHVTGGGAPDLQDDDGPCLCMEEVRQAVEAIGGRVSATDRSRRRTTVRLEFPGLGDDDAIQPVTDHAVLVVDEDGKTALAAGSMLPSATLVIRRTIDDVLAHDRGRVFDLVLCSEQTDPSCYAALRSAVLQPGGRLAVVTEDTAPTALCTQAIEEGFEVLHLPHLREELIS